MEPRTSSNTRFRMVRLPPHTIVRVDVSFNVTTVEQREVAHVATVPVGAPKVLQPARGPGLEAGHKRPGDERHPGITQARSHALEPTGQHQLVIVDEADDGASCSFDPLVPRRHETHLGHRKVANPRVGARFDGTGIRRSHIGVAVVHDEYVILPGGAASLQNRRQTGRQSFGMVPRGDDDAVVHFPLPCLSVSVPHQRLPAGAKRRPIDPTPLTAMLASGFRPTLSLEHDLGDTHAGALPGRGGGYSFIRRSRHASRAPPSTRRRREQPCWWCRAQAAAGRSTGRGSPPRARGRRCRTGVGPELSAERRVRGGSSEDADRSEQCQVARGERHRESDDRCSTTMGVSTQRQLVSTTAATTAAEANLRARFTGRPQP